MQVYWYSTVFELTTAQFLTGIGYGAGADIAADVINYRRVDVVVPEIGLERPHVDPVVVSL